MNPKDEKKPQKARIKLHKEQLKVLTREELDAVGGGELRKPDFSSDTIDCPTCQSCGSTSN